MSDESLQALRRLLDDDRKPCKRLFVAGDKATVGKTTMCLALLGYLREEVGLEAKELCYIKPATQSEAKDKVHEYCEQEGIDYIAGSSAPIVYYAGFTRAVIAGQTKIDLNKVAEAIHTLSHKKRFCIIDGVGFPGVGSCVAASNADIAKVAAAPVVLVAKSGVGSAIDAHCTNAALFEQAQVPVLGALFNKAPLEGFYAKQAIEPVIHDFFRQYRVRESCYGIIPMLPELEQSDGYRIHENIRHVAEHAALAELLLDACLDVFNRKRQNNPVPVVLGQPAQKVDESDSSTTTREAIENTIRRNYGAVVTGG